MDSALRDAVFRWMRKACEDLRIAKLLAAVPEPPLDAVCFHAQQAAEKAFKTFLVSVDAHVERTHSLPRLVELCRQNEPTFERFEETAPELTIYAVSGRYPDDGTSATVEEAKAAILYAESAIQFVENILSERKV